MQNGAMGAAEISEPGQGRKGLQTLGALTLALVLPLATPGYALSEQVKPHPITSDLWTRREDMPKSLLTAKETPDAKAFLVAPRDWDLSGPNPSPLLQADKTIYQSTRSLKGQPRWSLAQQDAEIDTPDAPFKAFACVLGQDIDPKQAPKLATLLGSIVKTIEEVQHGAKQDFARPRPYLALGGEICVPREDWLDKSGSHPSGHAATGMAWAMALSHVKPGLSNALIRRGTAYGESRIVCGVHYASDVEAGRRVGAASLAALSLKTSYWRAIHAARRELSALPKARVPARCAAEQATLAQPVGF